MPFITRHAKGLDRCLVDAGLEPGKLTVHISEIAPGTRAHPPHTHAAVEAFYVLEGQGVVEVGGERHEVSANQALILDASILHGLENTGTVPMRYMVIITPA